MKTIFILILCSIQAMAQYNGLGNSTLACLDKDGDLYGVGPLKVTGTNLVYSSNGVTLAATSQPTVVSGGTGGTDGGQVVTFTNGGGTGALGRVNVSGGVPSGAVVITNPGSGYTSVPTQGTVATVTGTVTFAGGALAAEFTSASHTFALEDTKRNISITAGSGFTTGSYQIRYVTGGTATVDRTAGTSGSTGGTFSMAGCLGPDADDRDPNVHSSAQAITKYGSVANFYLHAGAAAGNAVDTAAYNPTNYWVVAPSGGNDGSCTSHTFGVSPDPTAVTPCATINHVLSVIAAGDMMILRGGTHLPGIALADITSGTSSHPILYVAYPGEQPVIDFQNAGGWSHDAMSYWIIDGLRILNAGTAGISGGSNYGGPPYLTTGPSRSQGIRVRNTEVLLCTRGIFVFDGLVDNIYEDNMVHDENTIGGTHNIYLGGRSNPSSNIIVRRSILFGSGDSTGTGLQFNGRVSGMVAEDNLIYSNGLGGISFEMGVTNSTVRNNVIFNGPRSGFILFDYESGLCFDGSGNPSSSGTFGVCPYDQTGNLFENNTIWLGQYDPYGNLIPSLTPGLLTASDASNSGPHSFTGNTFRNNTVVNWDGWMVNTQGTITAAALQLTLDHNIYIPQSRGGAQNVLRDVTSGGTLYTFAGLAAITGWTVLGNTYADPQYTATNVNWWDTPANYDLRLLPAAPGVNTGSATGVSAQDVLGHTRTVTPSVGAYQYASGGTAVPLNTWTTVPTHGQPVQAVGWEKLRYGRAAKRSVYMGDYHISNNEPNNAFLMFDAETIRWDVAGMNGLWHNEMTNEAGHQDGIYDWDSTRNVFTALCCMTFGRQAENPYHTWQYDPVGQTGRDKHTSPSNNPLSGNESGWAYDAAHDKFILYSCNDGSVWEYDPATNAYTQFTPGTHPVAGLHLASMAYNADDGHVYLFGGQIGGATFKNDVWKYDQPTHSWSQLSIGGSTPAGRYAAGWDYDSTNHVFVLYGGFTDFQVTITNDTWQFDPVALAWTQLSTLAGDSCSSLVAPYERFSYDSDHNVFVLVQRTNGSNCGFASDAQWAVGSFVIQTWLFRVGGVGPNVGMLTTSPTPAAGSVNRHTTAWAQSAAIASDGTTLYAGWEESGLNSDATDGTYVHTYASQFSSGSWSAMGSAFSALNPETPSQCSPFAVDGHEPSMVSAGGTPWISYYAGCEQFTNVYAKSWTGSAWSGSTIGLINPFSLVASKVSQGQSALTAIGSTPYVAVIEVEELGIGSGNQETLVYVKHWNGSSWVQDGGMLNRQRTAGPTTECTASLQQCSRSFSIAASNTGSQPLVAFTEYLTDNNGSDNAPGVYVSQFNGSSWVALGSLISTSGKWAADPAITYLGGQPYVAYTERTQGGVAQVFVKTWNGSSWGLVGSGTLNKDTSTGWAFRPSLTNDGTNLFLGWIEQQAIGQRSQAYVDKWNGSAWSALGTSINADATNGSAMRASLAILSSQPVLSWSEVNFGATRQVYAKNWNGSSWVNLSSLCSISPTTLGAYTVTQNVGTVTMTANNCGGGTLNWTSSGLPAGLSGCTSVSGTTCTITGTLTTSATYNATISVSDGGSNSASITPTIVVNGAPVITTSSPLPGGTVGTSYSQALTVSPAGTTPGTWSVSSGTVPTGTNLGSTTGILSGTPTVANTFTFTALYTDANNITNSKSFSATINSSGSTTQPLMLGGRMVISR
jgi:hypothetical protein